MLHQPTSHPAAAREQTPGPQPADRGELKLAAPVRPRIGVGLKFLAAFGVVLIAASLSGVGSIVAVNRVSDAVDEVTERSQPLNEAAYDLETSKTEAGMGVVEYLDNPVLANIDRFREISQDFADSNRQFLMHAPTPAMRELGMRVATLYARYVDKGELLIAAKDREVALSARLSDSIKASGDSPAREPVPDAGLSDLLSALTSYLLSGPDADATSVRTFAAEAATRPADPKAVAERNALLNTVQDFLATRDVISREKIAFVALQEEIDDVIDFEMQRDVRRYLADVRTNAANNAALSERIEIVGLVLTLLIAVAAAILLSRSVVGSVSVLEKGATAIAGGKMDHRIAIRGRDEFRTLGDAFNRMATIVSGTRDELEGRIAERSALQASNRRLQTELSRRQEAEQQLLQASKLQSLGIFVSGIAHEFNNMLQVILSSASLAQNQLAPNEPVQQLVTQIIRGGERSRDLVARLLTFGRPEEANFREVDFVATVEESLELLRGTLPSTVRIVTALDAACGKVLVDKNQMQQIVLNLGNNALHAIGTSTGSIVIEAQAVEIEPSLAQQHQVAPGPYIKWSFADTGCGIEPEKLDSVFDPFFTTKPVGEGTGLGLSVVHGIVKAHRGAIWLTSQLERGTTVNILLPATRENPGPPGVEL